MHGLRLALLAAAAVVSLAATCRAPAVISYHEDLPAYVPEWGPPESRFGYHRVFWTDGSVVRPREYFDLGLRVGQRIGQVAFEEGLAATLFESSMDFGPGLALSLTKSLSVNTSCIMLIERYALVHECTSVMDCIGRSVDACRVADTEAPTGQRTQVPAPAGRGPETDGTTPGV